MKKLRSNKTIYLITWGLIFYASLLFLVYSGGNALDYHVFSRGIDRFMDFFNHIRYAEIRGLAHVYEINYNACFPPFIYLFYRFLGFLLPGNSEQLDGVDAYGILLYVVYVSVLSVIIAYTFFVFFDSQKHSRVLLILLTVVLSNIFVFGILERGNSAIIACILLLWAAMLKDSESNVEANLALIFIAMAAAIKVYPAVFGVIYIFEKRYKDAAKLIALGAAFFFIPFAFTGGIEGLIQFLANQSILQQEIHTGLQSINTVLKLLGVSSTRISGIVTAIFGLFCLFSIQLSKTEWEKYFLLATLMCVTPFWSGNYTRIYFLIPLLFFLKEDWSKVNGILAVLFAMIFSGFTFYSNEVEQYYGVPLGDIFLYGPIYLITFWIVIKTLLPNNWKVISANKIGSFMKFACLTLSLLILLLGAFKMNKTLHEGYKEIDLTAFDKFNDGAALVGDTLYLYENTDSASVASMPIFRPKDADRLRYRISVEGEENDSIFINLQDDVVLYNSRIDIVPGEQICEGTIEFSPLLKKQAYLLFAGVPKSDIRIQELSLSFYKYHEENLIYMVPGIVFVLLLVFLLLMEGDNHLNDDRKCC